MNPIAQPGAYFAPDYFIARERFIASASRRNAVLGAYPIAVRGRKDEALTVDTAYLGAEQPAKLVILSSGTHGVEGFAGSALQRLYLDELAGTALPGGCGVLLIHSINPYGFAFLRRTNENNVDLNRNGLEKFPGPVNAGYRTLNAWLNPASPPGRFDTFIPQGAWHVLTKGYTAVKQALAGGQYEYPRGIFYGGDRRERSTEIFDAILRDSRFADVKSVLHIDLHTGLGAYGTYKMLVDFPPASDQFRQMCGWFGSAQVATNHPEHSIAYTVTGLLGSVTAGRFIGAQVYPVVLEFGTYSLAHVVRMLRKENRVHHYGDVKSRTGWQIKAELLETFCPAAEAWRNTLIANGRRIFAQLRAGPLGA